MLGQSNFCQVSEYIKQRREPISVSYLILTLLFSLQELEFYDRSRLNGEMFEQLSHIIQRKEFSPQAVKSVSRACESLCRWVRAVYQYACVQRHMAPQEVKKIQLDLRIAESRSRLSVARLQEEETREHIDDLEKELLVLRGEQEELAGLLRKAEALEREASSAVQQVACHITDWKAAAEVILSPSLSLLIFLPFYPSLFFILPSLSLQPPFTLHTCLICTHASFPRWILFMFGVPLPGD